MSVSDPFLFQIGRTGTHFAAGGQSAAADFRQQRAILCRNAIEPSLLAQLAAAGAAARFEPETVEGLGHRWIERPSIVGAAIELAVNRPEFHAWLAALAGVAASGRVEGRLVETRAGGQDGLDWHNDRIDGARLGVTLHLRDCQYAGGAFELRDAASKQMLFRHARAAAGDFAIFEVDPRSEHRVLPVERGEARLVYTGWFIAAR